MTMEYLDIVDEEGNPTGEVIERSRAHAEGIRHRTSHVWLVRKKKESLQFLLQRRSDNKESFRGCYDISSAGHIPAGVGFKASAIRELKEELGVDADEDELIYCGDRKIVWDDVFDGKPFFDRQYTKVFALWRDMDEEEYILQEEEVSAVLWMDLDELIRAVKENTIPNCIHISELMMVRDAIT